VTNNGRTFLESARLWGWVVRLAGLAGILHETIIAETERPTLLLLFGAMVGLPAFLQLDRRLRDRNDRNDEDK